MFSMESKLCKPLRAAIKGGVLCDVRQFIEAGADVDEFDPDQMTSLHVATLEGQMAIVQYLVQVGSDVNKTDRFGVTPLMTACSHGFIEIARFLIQSGANVNAVNKYLESPLMYLCKGKLRVKAAYIAMYNGSEYLKTCASNDICGCLDIAKLLVSSGADINLVDDFDLSPLVGFIMYKHYAVAKYLIQSGADTNLTTIWGTTALGVACRSDYPLEVIEMLISAGADVNDARSCGGRTPLMDASYNSFDKVEALLRAGALVNAVDSKGDTALGYAVSGTNPSAIEILMKAGLSVGKELLLAVIIGHGESIQALITNGALPRTYGNMLSLEEDIKYYSRRPSSFDPSDFLVHKLLGHLNVLGVTSLTPFMVALMCKSTAVARYFVRNLFFHPLDILLLQDLQKKRFMLEDSGLDSCLSPLVFQPWSLFNLSFLCVSFAIGFSPDREERILLTGLPVSLHRMFLFRDKAAFLPVQDWANLEIIL